ncbi:hypothetical protein EYZ11_009617 [Aspergillus tanneri]|uniref:Uncharacterized protein n=1 Tax=Aspergillus tanneri TaxID=1220188 RepID=A0A4S3J9K8_9EURO|nr:uncharacterized protein ATNIH1004_003388 [Aspergillus tanneri]KAA8650700.1 hypothetical protein ATNIH1004_003388 [Aspergillus tanneri]THC90917.1 hypothetical protein EYZ11_009617 [Aspergillus tanneri]
MRPGVLVSIFFAVCVSSNDVKTEDYAKIKLSEIESNFKLDATNPPYAISDKTTKRCVAPCWDGEFYKRKQLERVHKVSAYQTKEEELTSYNSNPENSSTLTLTKSTAITEARTQGWTVGGIMDSGLLKITAQYTDTITVGKIETKTVGTEYPCPPLHECVIETWTFHVRITGVCSEPKPMLDCGGTHDLCATKEPHKRPCRSFSKNTVSGSKVEDECKDYMEDRKAPCEITTPVEESQKPYTVIVFRSAKKSSKRSELDQPQPDYQIISAN